MGDGKKEMLRKKTHVVRKKTHVVRKFFYVASIFGGAAGRKNRSPWELSSTPWELSSTAGDFSSTASRRRQRLQCVYRAPVFSRGAHTSLPDTNRFLSTLPLPSARRRVFFCVPPCKSSFRGSKLPAERCVPGSPSFTMDTPCSRAQWGHVAMRPRRLPAPPAHFFTPQAAGPAHESISY